MPESDDTSQQDRRRKAGDFMRMADELFQSADHDGALRLVLLALEIEPDNPFILAYRQRIQDAMDVGQAAENARIVAPHPTPESSGVGGASDDRRVSNVHEEVARLEAEKKKREAAEAQQRALMDEMAQRAALAESKRKAEEELRRKTEEEERRKTEEEARRVLDDARRQIEEEKKHVEEERLLRQEAEKKHKEEEEARKRLEGERRQMEEEMESRLQAEREKAAQLARESEERIESSRQVNEKEIRRMEEEYKRKLEEEKRSLTEEKERETEEVRARLEEELKKVRKLLKKQQARKERHEQPDGAEQAREGGGLEAEVIETLPEQQFDVLLDGFPSFTFGMASTIDMPAARGGNFGVMNCLSGNAKAWESDWIAVYEDLRKVVSQLEKETHGKR